MSAAPTLPITDQEFVPVILGGDRLGYSLARSFHMAYGYRTVVVSRMVGGPIAHSALIVHEPISTIEDPVALVATLRDLAPRIGAKKLLLLATTDHVVSVVARVKDQLSDLYAIPYADAALIDQITRKENFAQLCAELDIPHPATVVYDVSQFGSANPVTEEQISAMTFPIIAKPSNAEAYAAVEFDGKSKVHTAANRAELDDLLSKLHAAGYRDKFILQDTIPGDDQGMRILTCYVDTSGEVRFAAFGRVLLEEHSPETLGIPAAILTEVNHDAVAQATKLLERIGWRGYANFDMKLDPRTGETVFFELNPRLGGTSFYITAAGHNAIEWYVDEYIRGEDLSTRPFTEVTEAHVFSAIPMRLLMRYITDPATKQTVQRLAKSGGVTNQWFYKTERHPRRWAWIAANQVNYIRKYRQHYPEPKAAV